MDHQSYFQCNHCFQVVIRKYDPAVTPHVAQQGGTCRKTNPPPSFVCQFGTNVNELPAARNAAYVGYFTCNTCAARVTMPLYENVSGIFKTHCGCGGNLTYTTSAPAKSVTAYGTGDGWDAITTTMTPTQIKEEADSQEHVRAHLISTGYGFLGGEGQRLAQNVSNAEFTTYAPDWSIEEPGFANGQVVLVPRNARSSLGIGPSGTFPDFVVWDGQRKLAIELKTPKTYVQGGDRRILTKGGPTQGRQFTLNVNGTGVAFRVGQDIGRAVTWLLQYAVDTDREAIGRKNHMPGHYTNVFLIDLTAVGEEPAKVVQDLHAIAGQQSLRSANGRMYIYSPEWWTEYYGNPLFFVGGKIVDGTGADVQPQTERYDAIAQRFRATTICTTCQSPVPLEHRNVAGVCRVCAAFATNTCLRCARPGSPLCTTCFGVLGGAQMICAHPRPSVQEQRVGLCIPCLLAFAPVCKTCRSAIPAEHVNATGLCRVCYAQSRNRCIRCGAMGAALCANCTHLYSAARMICAHPRHSAMEQTAQMCSICLVAVLGTSGYTPT